MKLRKISEITATLPFTEFDFMQKYRDSFAPKTNNLSARMDLHRYMKDTAPLAVLKARGAFDVVWSEVKTK